MSVARFIADQRTLYRVPVAFCCAVLGVSVSWFYAWRDKAPTKTKMRRAKVDAAVAVAFTAARGLHGSPRLVVDLREKGWTVSEKTVAASMRRQGLVARKIKRRNGLTRRDKTAPKFPDLLRRDFTAAAINTKWVGRFHRDPDRSRQTVPGHVIDLYSRRLLGAATSRHPDAALASAAIEMAIAVRGGRQAISGVIFHTDKGSTYTAHSFTKLCRDNGIRQSMGRVGSCFDNAAAEAFFSTLEWEVLSRHEFTNPDHAQHVVAEWCFEFYNTHRCHSSAAMMTPVSFETAAALQPEAA